MATTATTSSKYFNGIRVGKKKMESVQNDGLLTSGAPQHHDQHPLSCSPQENTLIRGVTQQQGDLPCNSIDGILLLVLLNGYYY